MTVPSHLRYSGRSPQSQRAALEGIVRASPLLMEVLEALREIDLPVALGLGSLTLGALGIGGAGGPVGATLGSDVGGIGRVDGISGIVGLHVRVDLVGATQLFVHLAA